MAQPIPRPPPATRAVWSRSVTATLARGAGRGVSQTRAPALDQLDELGARHRAVAEGAEHVGGDGLRVLLLHPPHQHAEMHGLDHDADPARGERVVDRLRDLCGEALLHLEATYPRA
jgi:hypothetical protein